MGDAKYKNIVWPVVTECCSLSTGLRPLVMMCARRLRGETTLKPQHMVVLDAVCLSSQAALSEGTGTSPLSSQGLETGPQ